MRQPYRSRNPYRHLPVPLKTESPGDGGELSVPVLAEPRVAVKREVGGEARESTTVKPAALSEQDSCGAQQPLVSLDYVFGDIRKRFEEAGRKEA